MTAPLSTHAPLTAIAAALDGEVRDDYAVVGAGIIICRPTGQVRLVRRNGTSLVLGTFSDGVDRIVARYVAVTEGADAGAVSA